MQRHLIATIAVVCGFFARPGLVYGKSITTAIQFGEIHAHSGERGNFYLVSVSVPPDAEGKRLDRVFVEFAVDATPLSLEDSVASPVVGVFPLAQAFPGGGGGPQQNAVPIYEGAVPSARPVTTGENRVVRMDVTDIVRGWMDQPESNHGLVIGSLTGPEVGSVVLREVLPNSGAAVKLTFFYQNRFGGPITNE